MNPTKIQNPSIHIISLGAGVQSSTMALMAAAGEITPVPTAAIFADTQDEPSEVYAWLNYLEKQLPFPIIRITRGPLMVAAVVEGMVQEAGKNSYVGLPTYTQTGIKQRQCTKYFKI